MLDEFSAVKVDDKTPTVPSGQAPPAPPAAAGDQEPAVSEDEFAKQLQAGMADLLGELESSVSGRHTNPPPSTI
jgi:peroxin-19